MNYQELIDSKRHSLIKHGLDPEYQNNNLFDYQKYIYEYACTMGRCAVFLDTGLGKTLIELCLAANYANQTGKPSLIITPLAVAFQFVNEAKKFGIDGVEYSKDGTGLTKITVCNYERLDKFNYSDYGCVILDESSILKNFNGKIKHSVTVFMKQVKYRYLFTATPSPNDHIELGTSSEALGYMGYMDMLSAFFANNENNIRPQDIGTKFYLKPHAKQAFFNWVKTWSISVKRPSDIGFSDERHKLPKLNTLFHMVHNPDYWVMNNQITMFSQVAVRMSEVRDEQKATITQRCEKAVDLSSGHENTVYWCNFNDEGDLLEQIDKDSVQVNGSMSLDRKEEVLSAFSSGEIKNLITKPKITAFGLNWQHCNHTVYFPTFSFEQYYQAIRRFWRFGQKREVIADIVYSEGQKRVLMALQSKIERADELFSELARANMETYGKQVNFDKQLTKPTFI